MPTLTVRNLIVACDVAMLVGGNPYTMTLDLDGDWTGLDATVRICYGDSFEDFTASGRSVEIRMPDNVADAEIGIYSGRQSTTNRAHVEVLPSILGVTENSTEVEI